MKEPVETSGATVEEAIDRALEILRATDDEVEVQILSEGLPRGEAKVRVKMRDERTAEDLALLEEPEEDREEEEEEAPAGPEILEQMEAAKQFLNGLLATMEVEAEVTSSATASAAAVSINGPEMGLLIGRRGGTLDALQEVTRAAVQRAVGQRAWVNLDIEGYRERQRGIVERRARSVAARVRKSGRPQTLEPMTPYERKVVHDALAGFKGVTTSSEGEEPNRCVVIRPA